MLHSFRIRVTLSFGVLIALAMGALSYAALQRVARDAERDQGEALQALARSTAVVLSEGLFERMREIDLLAATFGAERGARDAATWQPVLEAMQRTRPQYAWIGVAAADGTVQAATRNLLVGADVSERPWFKAALQGPYAGDVHPAKLLAKLLPAASDGEPQRFIDFAAPLRDPQGRTIGVVGAHGSWDWAAEVVKTVRAEGVREKGVQIFILDREGKVIHHPAGPAANAQFASQQALPLQPARRDWSDGADYLTVAMPVPARDTLTRLGWTVVVRQPGALVLASAESARGGVLAAGAATALGVMALAWLMLGRFSGALLRIADAARRIEAGDLQVRLPASRESSELRQLSESLGGMTHTLVERERALAQANERLEARVAERTDALARANDELEKLARRDALTGLFNRRAADDRLREEFLRHARRPAELAVLLVDIDHFKRVNDGHGHAVGDEVLQEVALRLARSCRASDFVARFGGEEFLVLLPDTGTAGAWTLAEKLRMAVGEAPFATVGTVTLSIGVAVCSAAPAALDAVLRAADEALYCAKHAGRNRVVLHDDTPTRSVA